MTFMNSATLPGHPCVRSSGSAFWLPRARMQEVDAEAVNLRAGTAAPR